MKVSYVTTKSYPASTADHIYIKELIKQFQSFLGDSFLFLVRKRGNDLDGVNVLEISQPVRSRSFSFLILLIQSFVFKKDLSKTECFISNDFNLLFILGWFRRLTPFSYKLVLDAHLLTRTKRDSVVLKMVDKVITTSEVLRQHVIDAGIDSEKVTTVWGGVDVSRYEFISQEMVSKLRLKLNIQEKKVIGYIGGFRSLGHKKGLETMVEALLYLPEEYCVLLVGGSDEEVSELKTFADSLEVANRCVIKSKISYEEVSLYQKICDLLVIPYPDEPHFRDFGFPMKVFEYLASERPVVYSKLKIIDDFMMSYGHPFIPGNSDSLATSVVQAIKTKKNPVNIIDYNWQAKVEKILNYL